MPKSLKPSDFKEAIGLATGETKKLILTAAKYGNGYMDNGEKVSTLLSKYKWTGTRDYNTALIIIALYNFFRNFEPTTNFAQTTMCQPSSNSYRLMQCLAKGDGKKAKNHMNAAFENAVDTVLQVALPGDENKAKRENVIKNMKTQVGKIKPWITNGKTIKELIRKLSGDTIVELIPVKLIPKLSKREQYKHAMEDLPRAIKTGDLDSVKRFVPSLIDVNAKIRVDDYYQSILNHAVLSEQLDIVKYLVTNGANVNRYKSCPPLMHAIYNNRNTEIIKYLVQNGANVNAVYKDYYYSYTVLGAAADFSSKGSIELVNFLINSGAKVTDAVWKQIIRCHRPWIVTRFRLRQKFVDNSKQIEQILTLLLQHTTNFKVSYDEGYTHISLMYFLIYIIELIGANPNIISLCKDGIDSDSIYDVIKDNLIEIAKIMFNLKSGIKKIATPEWLFKAIERNRTEIAKLMIEKGAKLTSDCLFKAIAQNQTEIAKLMIEKGAKLTSDCLFMAIAQNQTEIAKLMIDKNPNLLKAKNDKKETPSEMALRLQNRELFAYITSKKKK